MTFADPDQILSNDESIQPSSTFTRNVMAAVRREAVEPVRLRFPWRRFSVGIAECSLFAAAETVVFANVQP